MIIRETTFREKSFREKTIRESNHPGNDCKPPGIQLYLWALNLNMRQLYVQPLKAAVAIVCVNYWTPNIAPVQKYYKWDIYIYWSGTCAEKKKKTKIFIWLKQ